MRLVIPLKPEDAVYLHAAGGENMRKSVASLKLGTEDGQLWHSGQQYASGPEPLKEPFGQQLMTVGTFRPYVWIGNAERARVHVLSVPRHLPVERGPVSGPA